jgi:virulence factor Mce-like protein
MRERLTGRAATAATGVLFAVVVLGLSTLGVARGFGAFSSSKTVTATLPEAGPALSTGSEVEYRGVLVGSLGSIHRTLHAAVLSLHLDPNQIDRIPSGVTVRLVPRSVFGDLYVDLVPPPPAASTGGHLRPGAHLVADTSTPTVELDQALDAGFRLLTSVQPAKLSATLTAVATALNGRGATLGRLIEQVETYTKQVVPHTAQFLHDIATIGTVGRELARDAPDLLATLDDAIATSRTIASSQHDISALLTAGPGVADQTTALLATNKARLAALVRLLRPVVGVLRDNQGNLVSGVTQLRAFLTGAADALGHGPYLKVTVTPDLNNADGTPYTAADCPRYPGMAGNNCPKGSHHKAADQRADPANLVVGAPRGSTSSSASSDAALEQRLAIAKVLLAPVLDALGVSLQ